MATCDMGYDHGEPAAEPPPPVVEVPGTSENDVEIAKVHADAQVKTEKIWADQRDEELVARVAELEGQLTGMREALAAVAPPPPGPEPVIIPAPEPEPEPEPELPPADKSTPPEPKKQGSNIFGF